MTKLNLLLRCKMVCIPIFKVLRKIWLSPERLKCFNKIQRPFMFKILCKAEKYDFFD